MKKYSVFFILICLVSVGVGITGCYKDIIAGDDPDGAPLFVSFKDDLVPIFSASCALSGCHVAGGHKPDLTPQNAYKALNNGVYVNTLIPKQSKLYQMIHGEMSTYIPSPVNKKKVYDWIRNGAPNN